MIIYKQGNILRDDADAIVNTVNCVGVMGRGIALQFKQMYPANFKAYHQACEQGEVQPGRMFVFATELLTGPRYIINFPTKRHWRGASHMEDIESGLQALKTSIQQYQIRSIAIPPLGCGLGGLKWEQVLPQIQAVLSDLPHVEVRIYPPSTEAAISQPVKNQTAPKMTAGRAALVGLIERYLSGLLDPEITLLELHKLMYFLQEAGEPLRLKYQKAHYGPYAENLRHVLNAIEGHLISGYVDGGDAPGKVLQLVPGASEDAEQFLQKNPATQARLERVAALVTGFESPYGLELLATVHWLAKQELHSTLDELIKHTHAWNTRKQQFTPRQIVLAQDILQRQGWIEPSGCV